MHEIVLEFLYYTFEPEKFEPEIFSQQKFKDCRHFSLNKPKLLKTGMANGCCLVFVRYAEAEILKIR